ncbi:GNAT family N-acetyltransferase [Planococcus halotolerans]|uniref:GNAT family N-acetyltransferase n=1 Tax=Planococcus halotolerans TaxID=2233542 RepID=A0A365KSP6_9BACL|nr:GNAT family N-acetyltransferase [Planococcus halotolerans]QHJ69279.1 GNAT family N-acetyltransferase [Planococcus halotolerans]RAZ75743.1 GNAT family N-acetyltransferase [Planococcus halotolerans]
MTWKIADFNELAAAELYEMLKLRVDVFVVEQNCPYPELDGLDQKSVHLAYRENGKILAYSRLVPGELKYGVPSIGRVIVSPDARGRGLARELMRKSIDFIFNEWQPEEIRLQGQVYLQEFYQSFGFDPISDVYDEDGIPHVDMRLDKRGSPNTSR